VASPKSVDTVAALTAKLKHAKGESISKAEEKLIRVYDELLHDEIRDGILLNLPKGIYCKLSGRANKVIDEQASRYGLAIDGAKIDLHQVMRRFHDILAEWGPTIKELEGENGEMRKEKMRLDISIQKKKDMLLDLELKSKSEEYIQRDLLRTRLTWLATKLRRAGERLGARFGSDAQRLLNDAIVEIEEEVA
jgi:hypothetical protein